MLRNTAPYAASFVAVAAILGGAAAEVAAQVPKDQQLCIADMNKAGAQLAAVQGKENIRCVRDGGRGREADPQDCLINDDRGRVLKARQKTTDAEAKRCGNPPPFGFAGAPVINQAVVDEEIALIDDVFGPDLGAAVIVPPTSARPGLDPIRAACQAAVAKTYERIAVTKLKEFIRCKRAGLKDATITDASGLEACIGVDPKEKIARAINKLVDAVLKRCEGVDVSSAFPGRCAAALDLAQCIDERVECRVCLMLNAIDGLNVDCDLFDDGASNGSCPPPSSPSGAFLDWTGSLL